MKNKNEHIITVPSRMLSKMPCLPADFSNYILSLAHTDGKKKAKDSFSPLSWSLCWLLNMKFQVIFANTSIQYISNTQHTESQNLN